MKTTHTTTPTTRPSTDPPAQARAQPSARRAVRSTARADSAEQSLGHQLRRRLFLCRQKKRAAGRRDRFEVEADRMADAVIAQDHPRVVEGTLSSVGAERLQAMCEECEEEAGGAVGTVQACDCGGGCGGCGGEEADRAADLDSPALRAGGRPLGAAERGFFEPRFGRSFAGVRVHTGPSSAAAAASLGARAFTRGRDVYFGSGEYAPGTRSGRWLLAHELSHVAQQGHAPLRGQAPAVGAASGGRLAPTEVLARLGDGEPLPTVARHRMEGAFGIGLGDVRVHRGAAAAEVAGSLGAEAFAVGRHVGFAPGAYRPDTPGGSVMLAHEVAHAIQQRDAEARIASGAAADQPDLSSNAAVEQDASAAAGGVALSLWARAVGAVSSTVGGAMPLLRTGLRLQRCATRTPDGVDVGPTDRTKAFCLKSGSFSRTFGVNSNTAASARGVQRIKFEGESSGTKDGKPCTCSCGLYRQWIRGYFRKGSATAAKRFDISSCGNVLTMNESSHIEEHISCIDLNDPDPCKWSYADAPGMPPLAAGEYAELKFEFLHQVWDHCQGVAVETRAKTLNINGTTAPRTITWT